MENGQTAGSNSTDVGALTGVSSGRESAARSVRQATSFPSAAFRRVLNRGARQRRRWVKDEPSSTAATDGLGHAPGVPSLLGTGLAVGATAGFLELLVQAVQVHGLHWIEWSTLTISRHAGWMVVVTSTLLSATLTLLLLSPALAWAALRQRQQVPVHRLAWTWDLAGTILGTLLFLGPLQTILGLHPAASVSLALGAGVRCRRLLVWRRRRGSAILAVSGSWWRGCFPFMHSGSGTRSPACPVASGQSRAPTPRT